MVHRRVVKHTLSNGMTVLVLPEHRIPKVSLQLWYNVGSRDEKAGERGLAHLVEHMIFKGTTNLSESDINLIVQKLSGYCNAFTSHDYTGYLFDFPSQHWHEALSMMSDCMRNCTFKEEFLQSELKAVIQELKMYNDDYHSTLLESLVEAIFPDHPYHYPVIGYKQDLWNLTRDSLIRFYEHHYIPNNATLVVVGDVNPHDVIGYATDYFGAIEPNLTYKKEQSYHMSDMRSISIKLYRDIKQPVAMLCWVVPGVRDKQDFVLDILSWILGGGKGSRLYRSIVDEHQLATDLESFVYDLFDYGLFVIQIQPGVALDLERIITLVEQELHNIAHQGPTDQELIRAVKKTEMDHVSLFENNQKLAYLIGKYFTAINDENYVIDYCDHAADTLRAKVQTLVSSYMRPTAMHKGIIVPLPEAERQQWIKLQELSDEEDQRILSRIDRSLEVEEGVHVHTIEPAPVVGFNYPKVSPTNLSNGLKLFALHQSQTPKIDIILDFKAKYIYDPEPLKGINLFLSDMLLEGTQHYTGQELMQEFDKHGMTINAFPGQLSLSMLRVDLEKGLQLLAEVIMRSTLPAESVEKIRSRLVAEDALFWDDPSRVAVQSAKEFIYQHHPYHKNMLGTRETLQAITRDDIVTAYQQWITPVGTRLAIVGDIADIALAPLLERSLSNWQGAIVEDLIYPPLAQVKKSEHNTIMNRDQTVLCYAGLSVARLHNDFDKLLLFDQIFTGGVLGSMSSRLFDLRERSGLFYTIGGSLIAGVDKEPGMILIKTIVSNDRLAEAERSIEELIDHAIDSITDDELQEAKQAIINSLVDNFASNRQTAASLLFLDYYHFPNNYFDIRPEQLSVITIDEVKQSVKKYLRTDSLIKIRVGR